MSFKNTKSHKKEIAEHFITKVLCWKMLLEINHKAEIERDSGSGVNDVFDWTAGIIYEVEPTIKEARREMKWALYKKDAYVKDLVIIPYDDILSKLKNLPFNKDTIYKWKKEIKRYIIP
jgi:hypothetical protein